MPIYNRRTLRQRLGREFLRDTLVGRTSGSWGTVGSYNIIDSSQADPTASGEQLYTRQYLRLLGSAGFIQDIRVGSFNTGSGAFVGNQALATTIFSGMPFEVHALVSPAEKDRALDEIISSLRYRQEVAINAIVDGYIYSIGPDIKRILDVRYLTDPTDSLSLGEHGITWWKREVTGSGTQLRINKALEASHQLIIEALLEPTLGSGDLATVNLLREDVVMWGAAAKCIWLVEQRAPSQEAGRYKERRREAEAKYTRLARRFGPKIATKVQLDEWW